MKDAHETYIGLTGKSDEGDREIDLEKIKALDLREEARQAREYHHIAAINIKGEYADILIIEDRAGIAFNSNATWGDWLTAKNGNGFIKLDDIDENGQAIFYDSEANYVLPTDESVLSLNRARS